MNDLILKKVIALQSGVLGLKTRAQDGQGMVEDALILAFIALLVIVALRFLQPHMNSTLNSVSNSL